MKTPRSAGMNRRRFLATTGLALAAPYVLTSYASTAGRRPAASERITVGVVGWGMQGPGNTKNLMGLPDCQVVAACDVDRDHLQQAVDTINEHYGNKDCAVYHDYREMMARTDIDAVMLAVPDQWHALVAIEAAKRKKDIFGEKPLARTIAEQQAIVRAVQKNKCIWQTGSWQRSERNFQYGAEIVRNGLIGKLTRVEVGLPSGHRDFAKTGEDTQPTAPPPDLDYNFWLGPSQWEEYIKARVHMNWRWNYNTGGGQLLDWVGHHCDIAHWGMGEDNNIGPYEVEGTGEFPPKDAVWNTATKYYVTAKYPHDITMILAGGYKEIRSGTKWIGTDGWVWVNRGNAFESSNPDWADSRSLPEEQRRIPLKRTNGHFRDFLDSIKSRKPTVSPVEVAHHSTIPGHLGLISMLTGRKIRWNSKKEVIIGDAQASKLLTRSYRAPWKLT